MRDGLDYPHQVTITTPAGGGSTDQSTGRYVPGGSATVVYDGRADVQDTPVALDFDAQGLPTLHAAAKIFFATLPSIEAIDVRQTGRVTGGHYGTEGRDFRVVGVRMLDEVVLVDWL